MNSELKDYAIVDPSNCIGIFPFIKKDTGDIEELETPLGYFKKMANPKITLDYYGLEEGHVITIEGSRYSKGFIQEAKKMASIWFDDTPQIFMEHTKEGELIPDRPLMMIFGFKMCFVLAPRVDND